MQHAGESLETSRAASPRRSVFGDWLVMREVAPPGAARGLGLPLACTEDATRAVRGALLHHAVDPPPPLLSGHQADGRSLQCPHAAFLALPALSASGALEPSPRAADARPLAPRRREAAAIAGVAIVAPRDSNLADFQALLLAAGRWERSGLRLTMGPLGAMQLERAEAGELSGSLDLDPAVWTARSRRWASVTPVALDRNPGKLTARDPGVRGRAAARAAEIAALSCEHVGLPRPAWLRVRRRSAFADVPSAPDFMPYPRYGGGFKRVCVHVELEFGAPVEGPVLLGVGRHFGLGLCRPIA